MNQLETDDMKRTMRKIVRDQNYYTYQKADVKWLTEQGYIKLSMWPGWSVSITEAGYFYLAEA